MNAYSAIKSVLDEVDTNIKVVASNPDVVTNPPIIAFDITGESTYFKDSSMDIRDCIVTVWSYTKDKTSGIELKEKIVEVMHSYNFKLASVTNAKGSTNHVFILRFKAKLMEHGNKIIEVYQ